MKSFSKQSYFIFLSMGFLFFISNGCHEKGCTDPHAINYTVVADEDDGSCIVCQTVQSESGTNSAELIDDISSRSIHFNEVVARVYIR